ncbi:MAG: Rrf2 family transcriptional regulator [Pseudothermotoga sp.]
MGITIKSEYAFKILLEIVGCENVEPLSLARILTKVRVPKEFAEKIMVELKEAGIIESTRGRKGGYRLTRSAEKITALDVVKAVDEPDRIIKCTLDENCCEDPSTCVIRKMIWEKLRESLQRTLESVTLKDMIENCQKGLRS